MRPANTTHSDLLAIHSYTGQRNKRPRLGQILVGAGLISPSNLHNCLRVARRTHQKLGAVLVDKQVISGQELESALLAQKFISDGIVNESSASKLLEAAANANLDLMTALKQVDFADSGLRASVSELPSVLVSSGLMKETVLEAAQALAKESGMSFVKTLIVINAVSTETLDAVLSAIVLVRVGSVSAQDVVKAIRDLRFNRIEVTKQTLTFPATDSKKSPPLGAMLVQSNCLNDFECLFAIETALSSHHQLGQMLIRSGLISENVIKDALTLQQFVSAGCITLEMASNALRRIEQQGSSLRQVAGELSLFKDAENSQEAIELLMQAGFIQPETVSRAILAVASYEMDPGKALLASGSVEPSLLKCAFSCVRHINKGNLNVKQAVELLKQTETGRFAKLQNIETAADEATAREAQKKLALPTKTPAERVQDEFAILVKSSELKQLIVLTGVLIAVGLGIFAFVPEQYLYQSLWAAGVAGIVALFKIGHSSTHREERKVIEEKARLEIAADTKTRLQKRNK